MARPRVKPGEEKGVGGAPRTLDEVAYNKMADDLLAWVEIAPVGATFGDFVCCTPYTRDQVDHAEAACEEFARKISLAKRKLAMKMREFGMQKNSSFAARLLPLVDRDYKEWRMQELKVQAMTALNPQAALDEIMGKSQSPIKE